VSRSRTITTEKIISDTPDAGPIPAFSLGEPVTPSASRVWWDYLDAELSTRDWGTDGIKVYLYRISSEPEKNGREGYLVRFEKPFDQEDLRRLPGVGGGSYTCHVKQGSKRIYVSSAFDIDGPRNPWTETPAAGAVGGNLAGDNAALVRLLEPFVRQAAGQVAGGVDVGAAVKNVLDMQAGAFTTTLQSIAAATGHANGGGGNGEDHLIKTIRLLAELGLIRKPGSDDGGGDFLSRAAETFSKLGLLKPPRSLAEEISDVMALTAQFGLGADGGGWQGVVRELAPKVLEGGAKIVGDLRRITEVRASLGAPGAGRVPGPGPRPAASPGAPGASPGAPVVVTSAAVPVPAAVVDRVEVGGLGGLDGGNIDAAPVVVEPGAAAPGEVMTAWDWLRHGARRALLRGASPADLFDFLDVNSPELLDTLAEMDAGKLEEFFQSDAILRDANPQKRFGTRVEFLASFLAICNEPPPVVPLPVEVERTERTRTAGGLV
jgi:hypothetical protein